MVVYCVLCIHRFSFGKLKICLHIPVHIDNDYDQSALFAPSLLQSYKIKHLCIRIYVADAAVYLTFTTTYFQLY